MAVSGVECVCLIEGGFNLLRTNLAVLLAERHTKITRVSADTGISRTTLTALAQNNSKMVQFETVDALCQYLKIQPADFFEYLPFSYSFITEPSFEFPSSDNEDFLRGDYEWKTEMFAMFIGGGLKDGAEKATIQFNVEAQAIQTKPRTGALDALATHEMNVLVYLDKNDKAKFMSYYSQMSEAAKTEYRDQAFSVFDAALLSETNKLEFPECQSLRVVLQFPDGYEKVTNNGSEPTKYDNGMPF